MALAVVLIHDSRPASADHATTITVWSATLTAQDLSNWASDPGCNDLVADVGSDPNLGCSTVAALTDDDFIYEGEDHEFRDFVLNSDGDLSFALEKTIPSGLKALVVDGRAFLLTEAALSDDAATNSVATWTSTGLSAWPVGATVSLILTAAPGPSHGDAVGVAQPGDARA